MRVLMRRRAACRAVASGFRKGQQWEPRRGYRRTARSRVHCQRRCVVLRRDEIRQEGIWDLGLAGADTHWLAARCPQPRNDATRNWLGGVCARCLRLAGGPGAQGGFASCRPANPIASQPGNPPVPFWGPRSQLIEQRDSGDSSLNPKPRKKRGTRRSMTPQQPPPHRLARPG